MTSTWPGNAVSTQAPNGMILKFATLQGGWISGSANAFVAVQDAGSSYILAVKDGDYFKMVQVSDTPSNGNGSVGVLMCMQLYLSTKLRYIQSKS